MMPAKKPTALKVLEGNRGHRPLPQDEPRPIKRMPKMPKELDDVARKCWRDIGPRLLKYELLTEIDGLVFSRLCQCYSRLKACTEYVNKHNQSLMQETIFIDSSGQEHRSMKISPYVSLELKLSSELKGLASKFGLTVVDRSGLSVGGGKGKQGLEKLID